MALKAKGDVSFLALDYKKDELIMAREARKLSRSGYSHVIMRGIAKMVLFEDRSDYLFFLKKMKSYSENTSVSICIYCLMDNHVHMLVYDPNTELSSFIKKLAISYSLFFNNKYERNGHLFQNRFISKPVEDDAYMNKVIRYILLNPEKAGICSAMKYEWSSIFEYNNKIAGTDMQVFRDMIRGYKGITDYLYSNEEIITDEYEFEGIRCDDKWAIKKSKEILGPIRVESISSLSKKERDPIIKKLYEAGIKESQIARITGLSRGVVRKANVAKE